MSFGIQIIKNFGRINGFSKKQPLCSTSTLIHIKKFIEPQIIAKNGILVSRSIVVSQPDFEGVVRSPLTFPKMGLGSPSGLLKTQSMITGVKTPCIEVFFIPLENS